jgi:hypothetical protein
VYAVIFSNNTYTLLPLISYNAAIIMFQYENKNSGIQFYYAMSTAYLNEYKEDKGTTAVSDHDFSEYAHPAIRSRLDAVESAVGNVPTLEQNVAAVLAALPTWTGGSY